MAQHEQITLYYSPLSFYSDRVLIALEEAKAKYTAYPIDLANKPDWYPKVNPVGKAPAMTYGGPATAPESPSPESTKLAESLALIEFIADLYPSSRLLPVDPVQRARVRRFYLQLDLTFPTPYRAFLMGEASPEALLDQFESLQRLLPETGFAVGEWSLADVALVPVLLRFEVMMASEIGKYAVGEGKRTLEILKSPRFARLARYLEEAKARPSIKATWNEAEAAKLFGNVTFFKRS
ncbi:thioredoxin-like protein [Earliella scabrosa]|nr:thioredoxin-like protein [Earliella scabrosa]